MKPTPLTDSDRSLLRQARALQRAYHTLYSTPAGQAVLDDLETRFETGLPCYQGKAGSFDPLDAMRRDAYREVILYINRQIKLGRQHQDTDQDQ